MRKETTVWILIAAMTASCHAPSAPEPKPSLGRIQENQVTQDKCSCRLKARPDNGSGELLLISAFSDMHKKRLAWANIDGAVKVLRQQKPCYFMTPGDKGVLEQCAYFKDGYFLATIMSFNFTGKNSNAVRGQLILRKSRSELRLDVEGTCVCSV